MHNVAIITFLIVSTLFSGCSFKKKKQDELAEHISPQPIVEIREQLPYNLPDAFDLVALVLSQYELYIPEGLSDSGKFSTTSLRLKDKMCNAQFLNDAPVSCKVRIHGKLVSQNTKSTTLYLSYRQHCMEQQHINNTCKNSNAEKLFFSIHKDIKHTLQ